MSVSKFLALSKGKSIFFLTTHQPKKKPFCTKFKKPLLTFFYQSSATLLSTVVRIFFEPTNLAGKYIFSIGQLVCTIFLSLGLEIYFMRLETAKGPKALSSVLKNLPSKINCLMLILGK